MRGLLERCVQFEDAMMRTRPLEKSLQPRRA
jgi:hypothetical protein